MELEFIKYKIDDNDYIISKTTIAIILAAVRKNQHDIARELKVSDEAVSQAILGKCQSSRVIRHIINQTPDALKPTLFCHSHMIHQDGEKVNSAV